MKKKSVIKDSSMRTIYFRMDRDAYDRWRETYTMGTEIGRTIAGLIVDDTARRGGAGKTQEE